MKKVIIVGAGENGRVAVNIFRRMSKFKFVGYLDDNKSGQLVIGRVADFRRYVSDHLFFVSIGDNESRRRVFESIRDGGAKFQNPVHPSAEIESDVVLCNNVMVGALSYVNEGTVIGDNTIVNNHCCVEHDNAIGAHCHLAPGVVTGGGVKIGDGAFVGLGARIRDRITVGRGVIISMGSVVHKSLPDRARQIGQRILLVNQKGDV